MTKFAIKPLGRVLQQAGLVSAAQIETALKEQAQSRPLRLGEILALRGWIKLETADFFALKLPVLSRKPRQPLGKYLKQAALLNEVQIQMILAEQKQTRQRIGEIAVAKGWLSQKTRHFFVQFQADLPKQDLTPERLFDRWRSTSNPGLRIGDRLLNNQQCNPFWLLELYRQILQQGSIPADRSPEQQELIKSGLVVRQQDRLKIAQPLYASVFNRAWVEREQTHLQPYRQLNLKKLEAKVESPGKVLEEILRWTNDQPWLAQKLYQLVCQSQQLIVAGEEAQRIEWLVQTAIINNWQQGVAAEHLLAVRDRLFKTSCPPTFLLGRYLQIWQQGQVPADGSLEQAKLLHSGLVVKQQNLLKVANPIYRSVFDQNWIVREMSNLLPESKAPLPIHSSQSQAATTTAQIPTQNRWSERAIWMLIYAAVAGVSAVIGFRFQQRLVPIASTPDSMAQSAQFEPVATFPPIQEVPPQSFKASDSFLVEVTSASEPNRALSSVSINIPTFPVGTNQEEWLQILGGPDCTIDTLLTAKAGEFCIQTEIAVEN